MNKYLIDTNICIYYLKGLFDLKEKFAKANPENCFISEITLAELKFGVENSNRKDKNSKVLNDFLSGISILPLFHSIDLYAAEKARLRKSGTPVDDFDLFIGATAITHNLIMVTNNVKEFSKIKGIQIENWAK